MTAPTPHDHAERVQGCFRCDLSHDEVAHAQVEELAAATGQGGWLMSSRPWTPRTWVVAITSGATSSTAVTLAGRGIWWPVVALAGVWVGIGIVCWWLWRDDRKTNENEEGA